MIFSETKQSSSLVDVSRKLERFRGSQFKIIEPVSRRDLIKVKIDLERFVGSSTVSILVIKH
jgi:hypothetical protein